MMMRRQLWAALCVVGLTASAFPAAQSASLRESLLSKAKELYGEAAPSTITFVTLSTEQLRLLPGRRGKVAAAAGEGTAAPTGAVPGGRAVQTRATQPGDSGTGVIVSEGGNQVYLDASPCQAKIMTFTNPYTKIELLTSVICGGREHKRYKFVQN
jgi:hypothetical protein